MRIIGFLNSYCDGISGGDVRFIEVLKRFGGFNKVVVTSELGKKICEKNRLDAEYLITTDEEHFKNVLFTYFKRLVKALSLKVNLNEGEILYSSSDFLPDILPAFVWKLRNKNIGWVALLHLLAPNPFYGYEQYYLKQKKVRLPAISAIFYKISQLLSIRLMKWKADKILTPNSEIKDYLIKKGIDKDRISLVANGINYREIQKIIPLNKDRYDALFVGRFHPQKGIFDLIKIWELVCKQKKDVKLALIGSKTEEFEDKVKDEIKNRNLEKNIYLMGFLEEAEKFKVIKSSVIFLCPSFYESWGIVIAEAMASGLPVVAYDLPIYQDIYEDKIFRVPIGDVNQFADTVTRLLTEEELRINLGLNGKKFILKYDWDRIAERELQIFGEGH
ncbi:MAG: glycosyltransferase family 4 protein [Thermotogota bacterium]|nr:glycosyltransferase family 4 protein [Thermotogota bacterium]